MLQHAVTRWTGALAAVTLGALACGRAVPKPVVETITQATLDSLPRITITDGRRLCEADGRVSCPLGGAFGNWLTDDQFAVWEPGRPVMIWNSRDSVATELGTTDGDQHGPVVALAVAREGSGYQVLVTGGEDRLLHYDKAGRLGKPSALPLIGGVFNRGFAGEVLLLERMRPEPGSRTANFELDVLGSPKDTSGRSIIRMPLPWLQMVNAITPEAAPFFPPWPSFGVDGKGNIAWSPGDRFVIHEIDAKGREQWTINGPFAGPQITSADIAARRAEALAPGSPEVLTQEQVDTMAARTGMYLPAITGIARSRKGDMIASAAISPARDSVTCYHISADGKLLGQFRLARRTRVVLFAGDSMLVHRPTEGEPWEVRWLHLSAAH